MKLLFVLVVSLLRAICFAQEVREVASADGSIAGTVMSTEEGIIPSKVTVFKQIAVSGLLYLVPKCTTNTDAIGRYSCTVPSSDGYVLVAQPLSPHAADDLSMYPITFYPSATSPEDASSISIKGDESTEANLVIPRVTAATIEGVLVEKPVSPTFFLTRSFSQSDLDMGPVKAIYRPESGNFSIPNLIDGYYQVKAYWSDFNGYHAGNAAVLLKRSMADPVDIHESVLTRINGTIVMSERGSKSPIFKVTLESLSRSGRSIESIPVGSDNSFSFSNVMAGTYRLRLLNNEDSYIQSVTSDYGKIVNQLIEVSGQFEQTKIMVQIGTNAVNISGTLSPSDKVGSADGVILQSLESGEITAIKTDTNRHFRAGGLAPGHYQLFAWEDLFDIPYLDPMLLFHYANQGEGIVLEESVPTVLLTPLQPLKYSAN